MIYNTVLLENELNRCQNIINFNPDNPQGYIQRGMINFKLAKIHDSLADFDYAETLNPQITPYLWQRGLSYYYVNRFAEGAKQFEIDLTVNSHDIEETIWRFLCIAQYQGFAQAKKSLLVVKNDGRLIMNKVYDLYHGDCPIDEVLITGEKQGNKGNFYAHLYVGLYYEAMGEKERSLDFITKGVNNYPINDYMWYLGYVHEKLRRELKNYIINHPF